MRHLGVSYLREGMIVGRNIYRADGKIVLGKGIELRQEYIDRLPNQGITAIYIEEPRVADIEIEDVISDEMRMKAVVECKQINDSLEKVYENIKTKKIAEGQISDLLEHTHAKLDKVAKAMASDFFLKKKPMINLIDTRVKEDYIYAHMVNVAALSMITAKGLGYKEDNIVDLAKGALVHDIGIIVGVPQEIRNKTEKLTSEEMDIIRKHPTIGYSLIRRMRGINILSAHVAYQHHERYNGTGYPRQLKEDKIAEYGYIAGIADLYDAITNNRIYKNRVSPEKAREFLLMSRDSFFAGYVVDKFLERVPAHPNGTTLILSDGSEAVVVRQNEENLSRPVVRVIKKNGIDIDKGIDIDLMENYSLMTEQDLLR